MAILYSGTEGTCQWTIDDQGHLYIGDGIISHNTTSATDWGWHPHTSKIESISSGHVTWATGANTYAMFAACPNLTSLDFSNFDTSNVTDMRDMFSYCQSLTSLDLSNFNTSNVTKMSHMFYDCEALTSLDVSSFDTSNVTNMNYMFANCESLTSLDLLNFNTSNVTEMKRMFDSCQALTSLNLSSFNTSNVTDMESMFEDCQSLTFIAVLSFWNVDSVNSSLNMFKNCNNLIGENGTVYNSSYTDKTYAHIDEGISNPGYLLKASGEEMYASFDSETGELRIFRDTLRKYTDGQVIDTITYWTGIEYITGATYPKWYDVRADIQLVNIVDEFNPRTAYYMFYGCENITSLDVSNLYTSNVTDMSNMFENCQSLTSLDLSDFDTSNVTSMNGMFKDCNHLTEIIVSNLWNINKIQHSTNMFQGCSSLQGRKGTVYDNNYVNATYAHVDGLEEGPGYLSTNNDLEKYAKFNSLNGILTIFEHFSNKYDDGQVINTTTYWTDIENLGKRTNPKWYDIKDNIYYINIATKFKPKTAYNLFNGCTNITTLNLNNLDTSNVTDMTRMFNGCSNLVSLNLSNFNTNKVTTMYNMFNGCSNLTLLDLSNLNTKFVTDMSYMFNGCNNLSTILVSKLWNINNVSNDTNMFFNCTNIKGQENTVYNSNYVDKTYARIDKGLEEPGYLTYKKSQNQNICPLYIKINNIWTDIISGYIKINEQWQQIF